MRKFAFTTLAIEVTRRCNMACEHCMRGDAQNIDLDPKALDALFARTEWIGSLGLTGGEPTLNPDALRLIREAAEKYNVRIDSVQCVTNGKEVSDEFLKNFTDLLMLCEDNEMSELSLSQDMFHDPVDERTRKRLSLLSVFNADDHKVKDDVPRLALGRAAESVWFETRDYQYMEPDTFIRYIDYYEHSLILEDIATMTVHGDLLGGCDYAYADTDKIKLGNVFDTNLLRDLSVRAGFSPLEINERVSISADSAELGLEDYNVRVSTTATIQGKALMNGKALVLLDEIDGDHNIQVYVPIRYCKPLVA